MSPLMSMIADYLSATGDAIALLQSSIGVPDILSAYRNGDIPRSGDVLHEGRSIGCYNFHGTECYVDLGSTKVDVQFDASGVPGSFDAWRLMRFAEETRGASLGELEEIEKRLDELCAAGKIRKSGPSESRRYRMASATQGCN